MLHTHRSHIYICVRAVVSLQLFQWVFAHSASFLLLLSSMKMHRMMHTKSVHNCTLPFQMKSNVHMHINDVNECSRQSADFDVIAWALHKLCLRVNCHRKFQYEKKTCRFTDIMIESFASGFWIVHIYCMFLYKSKKRQPHILKPFHWFITDFVVVVYNLQWVMKRTVNR